MQQKKQTKFICVECKTNYDLDEYVYSSVKKNCVEKQLCWTCAQKITPIDMTEWF